MKTNSSSPPVAVRKDRHIYEVPFGWYVVIKRGPVTYRAFFAFSKSALGNRQSALMQALSARDQFLIQYPKVVRSSTGVAGVSECTKWFHNKPYPCFQVTCGHPRNGIKRFYYKSGAQRERALRDAIAHRKMLEAQAINYQLPNSQLS